MWPQIRGWRHHFETSTTVGHRKSRPKDGSLVVRELRGWRFALAARERLPADPRAAELAQEATASGKPDYGPASGLVAADEPRSLSTVPSNVGSLKTSNKPTMENTTRVPIATEAVVSTTQYHITGHARTLVRSCLGPDDLREHPMGSFRLERQELFPAPRPRRSPRVRLRLSPTACPRRVHRLSTICGFSHALFATSGGTVHRWAFRHALNAALFRWK